MNIDDKVLGEDVSKFRTESMAAAGQSVWFAFLQLPVMLQSVGEAKPQRNAAQRTAAHRTAAWNHRSWNLLTGDQR